MGNFAGRRIIEFIFATMIAVYPAFALELSNGQWFSEYRVNPAHAIAILRETFERVRVKAVEHYRSTNNTARAAFVESMQPEMQVLQDRVQVAISIDKDASIERACQGYIVDVSSKLSR